MLQVVPVKPAAQEQANSFLPLFAHNPPFKHGLLKQASTSIEQENHARKQDGNLTFPLLAHFFSYSGRVTS